jgi:hypothetical protein
MFFQALSSMEAVPLQSQSQHLQDSLADLGQRYQFIVNEHGASPFLEIYLFS